MLPPRLSLLLAWLSPVRASAASTSSLSGNRAEAEAVWLCSTRNKERLRGTSNLALLIEQVSGCQANPLRLQVRHRIQANPFADWRAKDVKGQFGRHKLPGANIESPAKAIGVIGDGDQVLDGRDCLADD